MLETVHSSNTTGSLPRIQPPSTRLLNADQVAAEIFCGAQTADWVRRNCWVGRYKPSHKTVLWREADLRLAISRGERLTR